MTRPGSFKRPAAVHPHFTDKKTEARAIFPYGLESDRARVISQAVWPQSRNLISLPPRESPHPGGPRRAQEGEIGMGRTAGFGGRSASRGPGRGSSSQRHQQPGGGQHLRGSSVGTHLEKRTGRRWQIEKTRTQRTHRLCGTQVPDLEQALRPVSRGMGRGWGAHGSGSQLMARAAAPSPEYTWRRRPGQPTEVPQRPAQPHQLPVSLPELFIIIIIV